MYVGETGTGKTHNMMTYPRIAVISTEPNHHLTWETKPELKKNLVAHTYFIPEDNDTFKEYFINIKKKIAEYKKMFIDGKVDTLGIDNFTYLMKNRWIWQNKYQKLYSIKTGELDTRGMYGQLRSWAYQYVLMNIISFPGNVVLNTHLQVESEEAMKKKIDKSLDEVPNILGGFRDDIGGLFSNIFYLSKLEDKTKKGGYAFKARTNKGNGKNAKNRLGLPTIIDDVSYQAIMKAVQTIMGETK